VTPLFDSHSHIQMKHFDGDRIEVVERAIEAGVAHIAVCGDDIRTTVAAFELAERFPNVVVPTAGIHPHGASRTTQSTLDELQSLVARKGCAAVGELGLDFFRNHSTPEEQLPVLEAQLEMAVEANLPVVVHTRGAEDAIVAPLRAFAERSGLRKAGKPAGVMHCFGGTLEQACVFVELGFYVSLACTITYPKNEEARRIARELPLDVLLVETDSPFLPPQRIRGERNEPANVGAAAEAIATARGVPVESVRAATTRNAAHLFGIPVPGEAVPA
jgi:TatD DNase family protein